MVEITGRYDNCVIGKHLGLRQPGSTGMHCGSVGDKRKKERKAGRPGRSNTGTPRVMEDKTEVELERLVKDEGINRR